jgi:hypothetical protein
MASLRLRLAVAIAIACTGFSCQRVEKALRHGREPLPAEPPLSRVETGDGGVTIDVWLAPGISVSQVVDLAILQPLWPGVTPDAARLRLGAPTGIFVVGHETHYSYKTPRTTVAIVETIAMSSADGSSFKAYDLRAQVEAGFEGKMAPALRRVINGHSNARNVRLVSADAADPVIHLNLQNRVVRHVTAWPKQPQSTE